MLLNEISEVDAQIVIYLLCLYYLKVCFGNPEVWVAAVAQSVQATG
jgi:hypothetical protein